jgi:hypothetical protein
LTDCLQSHIIVKMRAVTTILIILLLSCSPEEQQQVHRNRFLESLRPASEIGVLTRLTQDGRALFPAFGPEDSIVFFKMLLVTDPETAAGRETEDIVKPYGVDVASKGLYTLSADYPYPERSSRQTSDIQHGVGENVVRALEAPDGKTIAYETTVGRNKDSHTIYLIKGDSVVQLTYGDLPCFLDRFSSTGRYLSAVCGRDPTWIIIFDLESGRVYIVDRVEDRLDYMTAFSSDDRMMAFIRSEKKYSMGLDFFGDIWLFRFRD